MFDVTHKFVLSDGAFVAFTPDPAIVELGADVERFERRVDLGRDPGSIAEDLRQMAQIRDRVDLVFARLAARFAASDEWDRQGSLSPQAWIRHECNMSGSAAGAAVCAGEQLASLPESTAAMLEGRIGYPHFTQLASLAAELDSADAATRAAVADAAAEAGAAGVATVESAASNDPDVPAARSRFDETLMLEKAMAHSVSRFRHDCAHARHMADAKGFLNDHIDAVELRSFELLPCEGGAVIRGRVDTEGYAIWRTVLDSLSKRQGRADTRKRKRRQGDAVVEAGRILLDQGTLPSHGGQRPHLQVTASMETVMCLNGAPAGELQFSQPIPAKTVERLACEAAVSKLVLDSKSMIVDVGRERRVPTAPTRRALAARDKGCVWPGCERPPLWTSAHHVRHWTRDHGYTDLGNLALVCTRHHFLVHEGGWQLARGDEGRWLAVPPLPGWPQPRVHAMYYQPKDDDDADETSPLGTLTPSGIVDAQPAPFTSGVQPTPGTRRALPSAALPGAQGGAPSDRPDALPSSS